MIRQGCLVQVNNAQHLIYSVTPDSGPSQLSVILSVQSTQSSNARLWNMRCDRLDLGTAFDKLLERQGLPVRVHKSRSRPCWLPSTLHRSLWNGEDDRKKRVLHRISILFLLLCEKLGLYHLYEQLSVRPTFFYQVFLNQGDELQLHGGDWNSSKP